MNFASLGGVEFFLLGPVEARVKDQVVSLGRRRERLLLGVLLLGAGKAIGIDRLVDLLWDEEPAPAARASLHSHVARLRSVLNRHGIRISTLGGAYVAEVDPSTVDVHRFRQRVERARRLTDQAQRAELLAHALGLWRGPLLADVTDDALRSRIGADLIELRLAAIEALAESELALGRSGPVVERLRGVVTEEPTHERLAGLLMLALYRDGRQAESLAAFARVRDTLDRELGIDPGAELAALHDRILRNDPSLSLPDPPDPQAHRRQFLPRDVPDFTGRTVELDRLDALAQPDRAAPTILITAISGTPGVGKTALAVHWGHRMAGRFPDGQLYLDLRGYDARRPTEPIDALAILLRALGVEPDRVPADTDEAAALLRAVLADQKVLIVLDNARSPSQVRPLLPASPDCLVLITSRENLTGLLVHDGARRLELEVMTPAESLALLVRIVGERRHAADPDALAELAAWCAHLPIALRVAGAMLVDRPHATVQALLNELRARGRLVALDIVDDPKSSLRVTFSHSLAALPAPVSDLFLRLGLTGGVHVDADAIAALCDITSERAATALHRLAEANLIIESAPGRYEMHDLLREYAEELAARSDDPDANTAAINRLHSWYLGGCDNAAALMYPQMVRLPADPDDRRGGPNLETRGEAAAWLEAQWSNLVAWFHAIKTRSPRQAWLLADALRGYFWLSCLNVEWLGVASAALELAEAAGDELAVAAAQLSLGNVHLNLNNHGLAIEHYAAARRSAEVAAWPEGRASALNNLATLHWLRGDLDEAGARLNEALALNRSIGRRLGEARNLSQLGQLALDRGQLAAAAALAGQALAIEVELDSISGQMKDTILLGVIAYRLGDLATAEARLTTARDGCRNLGETRGEVDALMALADLCLDQDRREEAAEYVGRAAVLARNIADPHGEADAANRAGALELRAGRFESAVSQFEEAARQADLAADDYPRIIAQTGLGSAWLELGRIGDAHAAAAAAVGLARRRGYRLLEAEALVVLAAIATAGGRPVEGADAAGAAVAICRESGYRLGMVRALLALADATSGAAHRDEAHAVLADIGIASANYRHA